ncbi:MAG: hypothetical protein OHK0017_08020 [Patescibacteria group bacterium]
MPKKTQSTTKQVTIRDWMQKLKNKVVSIPTISPKNLRAIEESLSSLSMLLAIYMDETLSVSPQAWHQIEQAEMQNPDQEIILD